MAAFKTQEFVLARATGDADLPAAAVSGKFN
jgi:hypothetical protein